MGRLTLTGGGGFANSANTKGEFHRDTSFEDVARILRQLSKALSLADERVCYVFGMGAQPKTKYDSLRGMAGVSVTFARSVLPKYVRFLSPVVASYEGLIKIEDPSRLSDVFLELMDRSMTGVYCFRRQIEHEFVATVRKETKSRRYDFGAKEDSGYCFYIVDADSDESKTGLVEIVSYGMDTPSDLIPQ
jgi:hypothetical protein